MLAPTPHDGSLSDTATPLLTCSWEAGLGTPPQEGLGIDSLTHPGLLQTQGEAPEWS